MPETEEQRRLRQANKAAATMFNVFPQGVGEQVGGAAQAAVGALGNVASRLANPLQSFVSDFGAARQAVSGTRLISRGGSQSVEPSTPPTTVLPSGTPMLGFDSYPTAQRGSPSFPQRTATVAQPQTQDQAEIPKFPTTGLGLMGNANISPLPTEQISPMTSISRIEGGPASMNINAPITAEAQGRRAIQTPYGTIYATQQQEENMQAPRTAAQQSSRSPAEQQALLAQMRRQGASIAQNYTQTMQNFAAQSAVPSGIPMTPPTNRFGQPIPDFQQSYARRNEQNVDRGRTLLSTLGSTGFGEMQGQQTAMVPPSIRTPSLFGGMGYASNLGGPQPASSMLATGPMDETRRRRIFGAV
jgi:hypothetical protein